MHRTFAFLLAFLILMTNAGLPFFAHICHGQDSAWWSLVLPTRSCCETKKARAKVEKACHAAIPAGIASESIKSKGCCEDRFDLLQLKSDFRAALENWVLKSGQFIAKLPPVLAFTADVLLFSSIYISFQPHAPPVPLYGRSLLVFKQVLLF